MRLVLLQADEKDPRPRTDSETHACVLLISPFEQLFFPDKSQPGSCFSSTGTCASILIKQTVSKKNNGLSLWNKVTTLETLISDLAFPRTAMPGICGAKLARSSAACYRYPSQRSVNVRWSNQTTSVDGLLANILASRERWCINVSKVARVTVCQDCIVVLSLLSCRIVT